MEMEKNKKNRYGFDFTPIVIILMLGSHLFKA